MNSSELLLQKPLGPSPSSCPSPRENPRLRNLLNILQQIFAVRQKPLAPSPSSCPSPRENPRLRNLLSILQQIFAVRQKHQLIAGAYPFVLYILIGGLFLVSPLVHARPAAVQVCIACHGESGMATTPSYPHLAGQKATYMYKQVMAYATDVRSDPLMTPFAKQLSEEQIWSVVRYYSGMTATTTKNNLEPVNQVGKNIRGQCITCHGVRGKTVNDEWPNLAGQNRTYLIKALKAFRQGVRPSIIMNTIAKDLTDEQIAAVAAYYSQLPISEN